jgi:hypothetical protein
VTAFVKLWCTVRWLFRCWVFVYGDSPSIVCVWCRVRHCWIIVCGWYSWEGLKMKRLCYIFRVLSEHYPWWTKENLKTSGPSLCLESERSEIDTPGKTGDCFSDHCGICGDYKGPWSGTEFDALLLHETKLRCGVLLMILVSFVLRITSVSKMSFIAANELDVGWIIKRTNIFIFFFGQTSVYH